MLYVLSYSSWCLLLIVIPAEKRCQHKKKKYKKIFCCAQTFHISNLFCLINFTYTPSPVVYLRSITDTVDVSIRILFWLTGVQTGLVFSYLAAQSCPTLTKLWFSLFLFLSQWVAADDNVAVGLLVQRVYGLSFWSSYRLCSYPIGRCVSHHQW